jgi:hypothetical protein
MPLSRLSRVSHDVDATVVRKTLSHFIAGNQSTGTLKFAWLAPQDGYFVDVRTKVGTAPASTALIVDVNKNGTTIFTSQAARPQIAAAGTSATSGAPAVTSFAKGDTISFDIDQIGTGTVGADLMVLVNYNASLGNPTV